MATSESCGMPAAGSTSLTRSTAGCRKTHDRGPGRSPIPGGGSGQLLGRPDLGQCDVPASLRARRGNPNRSRCRVVGVVTRFARPDAWSTAVSISCSGRPWRCIVSIRTSRCWSSRSIVISSVMVAPVRPPGAKLPRAWCRARHRCRQGDRSKPSAEQSSGSARPVYLTCHKQCLCAR
jgi:hypothetical protein